MNKDTHNIANNYFTLLTEAKKKVSKPIRPPTNKELTDPKKAYTYAETILKDRFPEGEEAIAKDPNYSMYYAYNVLKGKRFPLGEKTILEHPDKYQIANYAKNILKERWPEGEKEVVKNPIAAYHYARDVIEGEWPEAEPYIMKDAAAASNYASALLKRRWIEAEDIIKQNPRAWNNYIENLKKAGYVDEDNEEQDEDVINDPVYYDATTDSTDEIDACLGYASYHKKRWPELEKVLLDNYLLDQAIFYTMEILKKRWPELEEILYDPNNNDPHFNFPHLRKEYEDALKHINYEDED